MRVPGITLEHVQLKKSTKELSLGHPSRVSIDEPPIDPLGKSDATVGIHMFYEICGFVVRESIQVYIYIYIYIKNM